MSKKLLILACVLGIALASTAQDSLQTVNLREVVISASKIPLDEKETAKPVEIITAEQIERSGGKNMSQVLNEISGIIVNGAFSNPARNVSVFTRGASNEYTLILIDGIPVTDASGLGGAFDLRMIPLDEVERIEVLKGSQSTLYGSDAIAGIINIITKRPDDKPFSISGTLSAGSLSTSNISTGINGTLGVVGYGVNFSRFSTEGISEAQDPTGLNDFDNDKAVRNALNAQLEFKPLESVILRPFIRYSDFEGEFDNGAFFDARNDFRSELINPGITAEYSSKRFGMNVLYNFVQTERQFVIPPDEFPFDGRTHNLDIFGNYVVNENIRVVGGLYMQNARIVNESGATPDPSHTTTSPYLTTLLTGFKGLNLELGFRLNDHSEFGAHTTYSVAATYGVLQELDIIGSFTTGYLSPTLDQLFGPFGANPDLDPQTSKTYEGGIRFRLFDGQLKSSIIYFDRQIEDLIGFSTGGYENRNKQSNQGLEADLSYTVNDRISFSMFYNYLQGELLVPNLFSPGNTSFPNMSRRPKDSFSATVNISPRKDLFVSVQGLYLGPRSDTYFDPFVGSFIQTTLQPYFLVSSYMEYTYRERYKLFLDLKNITDIEYQEAYGFATLGFNLQAGVRFQL